MQINNMERIQHEVNWFTEKFDYRNKDAPGVTQKMLCHEAYRKYQDIAI